MKNPHYCKDSRLFFADLFSACFLWRRCLQPCLCPFRRRPGNVLTGCSESFSLSNSQWGAGVCFYQPCLCWLGFQPGLISGNPNNKHAFSSFISSFVRRSFWPRPFSLSLTLDPKEGRPSGRGHTSQPELQTITRVGNGISCSGNVSPLPTSTCLLCTSVFLYTP